MNLTQDHLLVARLFLSLKTTPQAQNYKPVNASEEGGGNEKCSRLAIFFSFQKTTFRANQIFYRTKKIICCKNLNLIFFQPAKAKILDREMSFVFQQNDQI